MAIYDQIIQSGQRSTKPFSIYSAARNQAEDRGMLREQHQMKRNLYSEQIKSKRQGRETAENKAEAQRIYPYLAQATRMRDPETAKMFLRNNMTHFQLDDKDQKNMEALLAMDEEMFIVNLHAARDKFAVAAGIKPPTPQGPEDVDIYYDENSPTKYTYGKRSESPGRPAPAPRSATGGAGGGGRRADVPVGMYNNINRAIANTVEGATFAPDTGEIIISDDQYRRQVLGMQSLAQQYYVEDRSLTPGEAVKKAAKAYGYDIPEPDPSGRTAPPPNPRPESRRDTSGIEVLGFE